MKFFLNLPTSELSLINKNTTLYNLFFHLAFVFSIC